MNDEFDIILKFEAGDCVACSYSEIGYRFLLGMFEGYCRGDTVVVQYTPEYFMNCVAPGLKIGGINPETRQLFSLKTKTLQ